MPQALINVHSFLQDFNPTKFTVYFCSLCFSLLFTLRIDRKITISYWLVFLPLWIWKLLAIFGAYVGVLIWFRNPNYRVSTSSYIHFKSMLLATSLQILLLMFEVIVCDNLETRRNSWSLAFIPLIFTSFLSVPVCIWSLRHGRGIELEFFAAVNLLQIIFIALKLEFQLNMSWLLVFLPTWILLTFLLIIISYVTVATAMISRSPDLGGEGEAQRQRANFRSIPTLSMIFLPLSVFLILLTSKLDSPSYMFTPGYFVTSVPLFITLIILTHSSFGSKPGSLWWFGIRTDFCTFLLNQFPCLKEFGNTSFTMSDQQSQRDGVASTEHQEQHYNIDVIPGSPSPSNNDQAPEPSSDTTGNPTGILKALRKWLHINKTSQQQSNIEEDAALHDEIKNNTLKLSIDTPD